MHAAGVGVGHVLAKHSAQVGHTPDDDVVCTLPPMTADDPLDVGVLPGARAALTTCSMPIELTREMNSLP